MSKGKAIRYSAAKKREVIKFVNDFNKKNGRGGQAAASKKYKIGSLSIAKWLKNESSPAKPRVQKAAATSGSLKSILARMTEIRDQVDNLHAEMKELYSSASQLAPGEKNSSIGNILSGKSKPWNSLKKEKPVFTIPPKMAKERKWTNQDGKTILATLISVKDEVAVLKVKGGTVYRYPVAALSKKNQEEIASLAS